jgi:hypothetical protein
VLGLVSVYVLGAGHPNSKSIVLKAVAGRPEEAITLNPMRGVDVPLALEGKV